MIRILAFAALLGPLSAAAESGAKPEAPSRMGLAVSLALEPSVWSEIAISTPPALAASRFISAGHYRLELLQLILLAQDSKGPLEPLLEKRRSGRSLREIAGGLSLSFDSVYERAQALAAEVDRRLLQIERIRTSRDP